jgi:hypothetical protein
MWRRVMALVISVGLAAGVTGPKLYKMAQIKGWQPGATVTTGVITDKGVNQGRYGFKHWVSWTNHGGALTRDDRDNVNAEDWESMRVGDRVDVVRVPGDDGAYLRNGVFVETGNFVFDFVLLAAEIITALVMVILLFRSRRGRTPGRRGR